MNSATSLAQRGEDFAASLYHEVLARNIRYPFGEIDIVARDENGTTVFVEVKTRSTRSYGGAEAVDQRKLSRVRRAAARWLRENSAAEIRFDVVELVVNGADFDVARYEGVLDGAR